MSEASSNASKNRLFNRVFICMKCNAKIKAEPLKVRAGKIKCRKCGNHDLRGKNRGRVAK